MKFKAFILHLHRSSQRLENALILQKRLPGPAEIFECVDGHSLTTRELSENYQRNYFLPYYPFEMNVGEIGLFLTFRKLWRHILDDGIDIALIAEDDIAIDNKHFDLAFELAYQHAQDRQHIKFGLRSLRSCLSQRRYGNYTLAIEKTVPFGTVCHLVTNRSAEQLLDTTKVFDRPVDSHMQLVKYTGQTISTIWPSGIKEISSFLGGSSIHQTKARFDPVMQLRREVNRSLYRVKIKLLHRQFIPSYKNNL